MTYLKLLLLIFSLLIISIKSQQWKNSRYGTDNYNLELDAINEAKLLKIKWDEETIPRKSLLCGVFLSGNQGSLITLDKNIQQTQGICDWSIILYDGDEDIICNKYKKYSNVVNCMRNEESKAPRFYKGTDIKMSIAKTVMYKDILNNIKQYNKVMLFDEDILLQDFNFDNYLTAWACVNKYEPLIVQPLIQESTQYLFWCNLKSWDRPDTQDIVGHEIELIEQQVPSFDAKFFEWYVTSVIGRVRESIIANGADWGQDRSWCAAAKMFGEVVLKYPHGAPVCMLYPKSGAVHHLNGRTIQTKRLNRNLFREGARRVVQAYIDAFPTWVITDVMISNPFIGHGKKHFKKFRYDSIDGSCPMETFGFKDYGISFNSNGRNRYKKNK